jgi:uncharacterized phage infection (PIP) family protein YhgE
MVAESLVSELIAKGVERIASRKKLTSQDLTVLLLHEQSQGLSRLEKGMEEIAGGVAGIASELKELRKDVVTLMNQAKDIAEIRARVERIEAKVS